MVSRKASNEAGKDASKAAIETFLSAPAENQDAFWESDGLIWVDWREYDESIIDYFNEHLPEGAKIDYVCQDTAQARGFDILLNKNGVSAPIPYGEDAADRDTTLRSIQAYLAPEYQIRWYLDSLGSDTLAFCLLSTAQWAQLEQQFGQAQVAHYFAPITADSKMFEMELDEASRLLKARKGR